MKYLAPFRVATYLLILFFCGHTFGGMLSRTSVGEEGDAVFASMERVQFAFNGATCSWYGFWFGFGIMVSVFLLLSAFVSWRLADAPPAAVAFARPIAWALCISHVATAALSWGYFFAGPGVFATLAALLVGVGAARMRPA